MQEETLAARLGRSVTVDLCASCQCLWFDEHESLVLTPGATLALFKTIGDRVAPPVRTNAELAKCPRCHAHLLRTHDMQRTTRFEYLRCPHDHGHLITFFDFLRQKDFIRPLTPEQLAALRQNVQSVTCSSCGAPVDLTAGATCQHCGAPLSMLDIPHAQNLVQQLQQAEDRTSGPVDPSLPLELARARREVDLAFNGAAIARWLGTSVD